MSLAAPFGAVTGLKAVPPAIAVGPFPLSIDFVGLADLLPARLLGRLALALPMVDLAFAAPVLAVVLAESIILLKKPLRFDCGELSPPRRPPDPAGSLSQSAIPPKPA
jgi:hypothetical protein